MTSQYLLMCLRACSAVTGVNESTGANFAIDRIGAAARFVCLQAPHEFANLVPLVFLHFCPRCATVRHRCAVGKPARRREGTERDAHLGAPSFLSLKARRTGDKPKDSA